MILTRFASAVVSHGLPNRFPCTQAHSRPSAPSLRDAATEKTRTQDRQAVGRVGQLITNVRRRSETSLPSPWNIDHLGSSETYATQSAPNPEIQHQPSLITLGQVAAELAAGSDPLVTASSGGIISPLRSSISIPIASQLPMLSDPGVAVSEASHVSPRDRRVNDDVTFHLDPGSSSSTGTVPPKATMLNLADFPNFDDPGKYQPCLVKQNIR